MKNLHKNLGAVDSSSLALVYVDGPTTEVTKPLDPDYVSGFSDAESCFVIKISRCGKSKTGWRIDPAFEIGLNVKDLALLEQFKAFFGVGTIRLKASNNSAIYSVQSVKDLICVIIPHFDKYSLITQKRADFELFKQVLGLMVKKEHLTKEGLQEVVNLRASMNKGLSETQKGAFPDSVCVERPLLQLTESINLGWLAGFVDGEGCFLISVVRQAKNNVGFTVALRFSITQHSRDLKLMEELVRVLGCGSIVMQPKKGTVELVVTKFGDIQDKIIPIFDQYPLQGAKSLNYRDFCKGAQLIKAKAHLTPEGLNQILEIKTGMNKGRKAD